MTLNEAKELFALTVPVERAKLKRLYRALALKYHPDTGGDTSSFQLIDEAYKLLLVNASLILVDIRERVTEEGTSLSELGLGLSPLKNGIECKDCKGAGYREISGIEWWPCKPCERCQALRSTFGCRQCEGSSGLYGKPRFTKKNVKAYRVCARCQGKGAIELLNPVIPRGFLAAPALGQKARKRLTHPA